MDGQYCQNLKRGRWLLGTLNGAAHAVYPANCAAPNKCRYCATRIAVQNARMLEIDARRGPAPEVWAVLTTRLPTLDGKGFYDGRRLVLRALRRRWPTEYCCLLEYTTGYTERSGGKRRPHWNLLLKGPPADARDEVREIVRRVWCSHIDAKPQAQHVGTVHEVGGLSRYLALHFMKESQKPPKGFTGKRFQPSHGYFNEGRTAEEVREEAKQLLILEHLYGTATRKHGLAEADARRWVEEQLELRDQIDWTLIQLYTGRWKEPNVRVLSGEPLALDRQATPEPESRPPHHEDSDG